VVCACGNGCQFSREAIGWQPGFACLAAKGGIWHGLSESLPSSSSYVPVLALRGDDEPRITDLEGGPDLWASMEPCRGRQRILSSPQG
jgi:hypothetical protein